MRKCYLFSVSKKQITITKRISKWAICRLKMRGDCYRTYARIRFTLIHFFSLSYRYLFAAVLRFYTRRLTCVNVTFQRSTIESSKFSFSDRQRRQNDDKYIRTYVETDSTYILRYCAAAWLLLTMPDATVCSTHIWSIVSVEKKTHISFYFR